MLLYFYFLVFIFIIIYLSINKSSNFKNKKYLTNIDFKDALKSKFYSLKSGMNEKSLISKINSYI